MGILKKNKPGKSEGQALTLDLVGGLLPVSCGKRRKLATTAPLRLLCPQIQNLYGVWMHGKVDLGLPLMADSCLGRAVALRSDARELRLRSLADSSAAVGIQIRYFVLVLTQFKAYK